MSESDDLLIRIGDSLAGLLVTHGMTADSAVLDVGCGYGRLALGILHSTEYRGSYLGFDILPRQIDWCQTAISPLFPTMQFAHLDVRNARYNPTGTIEPTSVSFPARSARTDVCALISVFTHLYRPDIERYLSEIRRVLRPGGVAITTWFVFDEARLAHATSPEALYPMIHVLDDLTRYMDEADPLRAIAYDEQAVRAMVQTARLEVVAVERGTWAGEPGSMPQDLVVLRRSASDTTIDPEPKGPERPGRAVVVARRALERARPAANKIRKLAGRVRRRIRRQLGRGRGPAGKS